MDGDLERTINAVLSDPEQLGKIAQMAQKLMGGQSGAETSSEEHTDPAPEPDAKLLGLLGRVMSGGGTEGKWTPLIRAMKPYLRPERQEKMDKALNIARMVRVAGSVMQEYGGGEHGL